MELTRLSHRHEQIVNWMLANPHRPLRDCAAFFGYSQAWLSQVIHSDLFQAVYRERCDELGIEVVHSMKARLMGATALALEKTAERLQNGASDQFLRDTTKNLLENLGYLEGTRGANGHKDSSPASTTVNVTLVDGRAIADARDKAARLRLVASGVGEKVA